MIKKYKKSIVNKTIIIILILLVGYCTISINTQPRDVIKINIGDGIELSFYTIPGITPEAVWINFENNGWQKENQLSKNNELVTWIMTNKNNNVEQIIEIIGVPNSEFISARGTIISSDKNALNDIAQNTLGFLASIPYEKSKPIEAKQWVEKNINNKDAETIINGVKFKILYPSKFIRGLIIENEKNNI